MTRFFRKFVSSFESTIKRTIPGYPVKRLMDFVRFIFSRQFLKHLLLAAGLTVLLTWIIMRGLAWYTKHNDYIVVPDLRGMYLKDVQAGEQYRNYQFAVIDSLFDADKPKGSILTQDPSPGAKVKKDRTVYLTVTSIVPEKTTMPDLRDLTLRQAQTMLEAAGLKLGKLLYIRTFDEDAVQNQLFEGKAIRPGTILNKGSLISLTVGMGAKAAEVVRDTVGDNGSEQ